MKLVLRIAILAPIMLCLPGCLSFLGFGGNIDPTPPAERQLPASTQALLAIKGMRQEAPIFVRIFKEESELEIWKLKGGRFHLFRTYPICAWSGGLGPKVQTGDRQSPEGFYTVSRAQMNPHSLYHLAFNIGFPNAYDQSNGHTGSALMVHGDCKSVGCYAMTDAYIEEIYILAREAFNGGQTRFHVQALPFRMTAENMQKHRDSPWYPFWLKLKEGYDSFEMTGKPPVIKVCSKQYFVNVKFHGEDPTPEESCPSYSKIDPMQIAGIDGVPPAELAALNKLDSAQPHAEPAVMTASAQPAEETSATADTSASAVISRPVGAPALASMQPVRSAPVPAYQPVQPPAQSASSRVSTGSAAQAVNYSPSGIITAPGFTADDPSKDVDPNAIQKLNRSGKGGKLTVDGLSALGGGAQ